MFVSKAMSNPKRGETERFSTWLGSWLYPKTLEQAGKTLFRRISKLRP
jgi:hypothetical protein